MAALDGDNEYNRAAPGGIVHSVHPSFSSPRAPSSGAFVDRVIETKAMSEDAAPFGLPFEHYFLILSRIDYGPLNDFLSADAFAENIAEIERQASQDADASDLAQAYREAATLALRRNAAPLQITHFACGIRTCMGELTGGNDSSYAYWVSEFMAEGEINAGFRQVTIDTGQGTSSLRFFFYVDGFLEVDSDS